VAGICRLFLPTVFIGVVGFVAAFSAEFAAVTALAAAAA
jgi:hypothetical protein